MMQACMSKQIIANIPTTPTLSNKILDACLRVDKVANGEGLDKAFKWFTHTPKTNHMSTMQYDKRHVRMEVQPYTVTKLMRALTASERYADAAVVFKHWNKKMDLELSAYHVLFDIAAKDSTHLSAGVKHMEKMRQIGPIPNEKCYTDLAAAALHHGKKEIAARVMSYYELDAMKESVLSRRLRAESAEK
ncbi:hypothetical protein SARC_11619 [Sphaeroforma arctica JP610]|uniref:Pentacotripeptide-repeat region of PRORP domain-containing protein n=1 Tax=Sphaeroforma arctica JP610 TaxID=667725 RepID=A0A0L0FGF6_9EUKA|nr:hypothetical protein SARC_11619 [Sphaeroforma arctica JP610]KNC75864.1 hypothetical protein SARC_11619 [Sphaeroforma arctica JP610]|eukprot:XP_014149766.1 hypothetical protein SARC_11619 [Sphaeroforma arctica JP610]